MQLLRAPGGIQALSWRFGKGWVDQESVGATSLEESHSKAPSLLQTTTVSSAVVHSPSHYLSGHFPDVFQA